MSGRHVPDDGKVLRAIVAAAENNRPCPSNPDIADILGASSPSAGVNCLNRLVERGLIEVRRYQCSRQVVVIETGKATYLHPSQAIKHWRDRGAGYIARPKKPPTSKRYRAIIKSNASAERDADVALRVNRDPCPRCGVRADIGCEHAHARMSMGAFA